MKIKALDFLKATIIIIMPIILCSVLFLWFRQLSESSTETGNINYFNMYIFPAIYYFLIGAYLGFIVRCRLFNDNKKINYIVFSIPLIYLLIMTIFYMTIPFLYRNISNQLLLIFLGVYAYKIYSLYKKKVE